MLRAALEAETEPQVRAAMAFGVAAMDLAGDDPDKRLAAIDLLAGSLDPQARGLLGEVAADPKAPPEVKAAAEQAIAAVERNRRLLDLVSNLYQGISLGSILLLAAIGLAITFGVMGVINMAHGEMIMLGAYSAFVVQELFRAFLPPAWFDLYLVAAVPAAFVVAGVVGIAHRARRHPVPLRSPARDAARHLGREPDPAAGGAHDLRRAQPGGRQPELDVRRARARRRPVPDLEPPDHHRLLPRRARRRGAGPALHPLRPRDARRDPEPRAPPRPWASTPRGSMR